MAPRVRAILPFFPSLLFLAGSLSGLVSCGDSAGDGGPAAAAGAPVPDGTPATDGSTGPRADAPPETPADPPLEGYREELLELAFEAVSKFPTVPHAKNRARAQETVVDACFEIGQPLRALRYAERITNWRRGSGFAEYAFACAERGDESAALHHLELAREVADDPADETLIGWRQSRIRAGMAKTYALLGMDEEVAELTVGLDESQAAELERLGARLAPREVVEADLVSMEEIIVRGSFDQIRNALQRCLEYYDRFYDDEDLRGRAKKKVRAAEGKLPLSVHIEVLAELAGIALDHGNRSEGLELVDESERLMAGARWSPEHLIPPVARLAGLRYRAGEETKARDDADGALVLFDSELERIVDIERQETLVPVAEAYLVMGAAAAARSVYARALKEAVHNPNSRPRAFDLCEICCSMAVNGFEPDAELRARLREIAAALGDPW